MILHTHTAESDGTPLHAAFRVPVGLYSVLPQNWHVADGYVTWYCNGDCTDSGSAGGCTPRDGGIMNWPDDAAEDDSFRQCLMDSVEKQGGEWAPLEDCQGTLYFLVTWVGKPNYLGFNTPLSLKSFNSVPRP